MAFSGVQNKLAALVFAGITTANAPAVSASGGASAYYDSTLNQFMFSQNGAAYAGLGSQFGSQNITTTGSLLLGTSPAGAGTLRLPSAGTITFHNNAGSANITGMTTDATDVILIGETSQTAGVTINCKSAGTVKLVVNSAVGVSWNGTSVVIGTASSQSAWTFAANTMSSAQALANPTINTTTRTSDAATTNFTVQAQSAFASATGTNRNGAQLILKGGTKASGGTDGGVKLEGGAGTIQIQVDETGVGFYNTATQAKQTVSGSRGGIAALASALTALSTIGLITDSSSA